MLHLESGGGHARWMSKVCLPCCFAICSRFERAFLTSLEAMNTSQKVVALDARYNTRRPLSNQHRKSKHCMLNLQVNYVKHSIYVDIFSSGMLYIRRRNQLLQDNAKHTRDSTIRETYLKQRSMILSHKYGSLKK